MKKPFNPDDFDVDLRVSDVVERFPELKDVDFTQVSLKKEVVKYNYEVVSPDYEDLKYKDIKDYYDIEVDTIV